MAYTADIENALVTICAEVLFPGQTYAPGSVQASVQGPNVRLYRGWPVAQQLDADVKGGDVATDPLSAFTVNVSVYPPPGKTRNTTKYLRQWRVPVTVLPTITASVTGQTVTFAGTVNASNTVAIAIGNAGYAYRATSSDTLTTIAAAFAAAIPDASCNGGVLTLAGSSGVTVRVGADQTSVSETRRQTQEYWVTIWAPSTQTRDIIAAALDQAFADVHSVPVPDNSTTGPLRYVGARADDMPSKARIWRMTLVYEIEYATADTETTPPMLLPGLNLTVVEPYGSLSAIPADPTITIVPERATTVDIVTINTPSS